MRFYDRYLLPWVVEFTCSRKPQMRQRQKIVPQASGEVLEIGFGSGLNLPFYDAAKIERIWALEPAEEMWRQAEARRRSMRVPVELLRAPAESIPLASGTVDTVLVTYTLCTISDVGAALAEARRVLRSDGRLLFCEHGAAPDRRVLRWQNRINALWKTFGGGCNLNRQIPELLETARFRIERLWAMYLPGWKPASFNFWGTAVPR